MGILQSSITKHEALLDEEYLYGLVAEEMSNGSLRPGLMAKSLVESEGDQKKAEARYIKLRVDLLRTEGAAIVELARQAKANEAAAAKILSSDIQQPTNPPPSSGNPLGGLVLLGIVGYVVYLLFFTPERSNNAGITQATPPAPIEQVKQYTPAIDPPSLPDQYQTVLKAVEASHPVLNPDAPVFRQDLMEQVANRMTEYTRRGYSRVRALQIAVEDMDRGAAPVSALPRVASNAPTATHQTVIARPQQPDGDRNCEYKAVMTNDDYRACGLSPPQSRPLEPRPAPAAVSPEAYDKGNHPGFPPNCRWLSQSEFSCK